MQVVARICTRVAHVPSTLSRACQHATSTPCFVASRAGLVAASHPIRQQRLARRAADAPRRRFRASATSEGGEGDDGAAAGFETKQLKETAMLDKFIDTLIAATSQEELTRLVAENLLSCDQRFWIRLATRSDSASSQEEKDNLAALAKTVMFLVDAMVKKTEGQLTQSADSLQAILVAAAEPNGEWQLPLAPERLDAMRAAMDEQAGDAAGHEALLSNAFAWMRKASEDKLEGMVALLQKVLQVYAARELTRGVLPPGAGPGDELVRQVLAADEERWEALIHEGASSSGSPVSESAFMEALQKKMEATVLAQASGSYAQRVQAEYLKEVESRAKDVFKQLAASA